MKCVNISDYHFPDHECINHAMFKPGEIRRLNIIIDIYIYIYIYIYMCVCMCVCVCGGGGVCVSMITNDSIGITLYNYSNK